MARHRLTLRLALSLLIFVVSSTAFSCRSNEPQPTQPRASVAPPARATTTPARVQPITTRTTAYDPRELTVPSSHLRELELSLSAIESIGRSDEQRARACEALDFRHIADMAPKLEHLRVFGCQMNVARGLEALAPSLRRLELGDIVLDAPLIRAITALSGLHTLVLTRVKPSEASLHPLGQLRLRTIVLQELERDSILAEAVKLWPRSLRRIELIGSWARHNALIEVGKATAVEALSLQHTQAGNFSIHQIKALTSLHTIDLAGGTFNDTTPLYLRDLPITNFRCACPRLGDVGLRAIRRLEQLQQLELPDSRITGDGLAALTKLEHLRSVTILGRELKPNGFSALAEFRQLRRLVLGGTELEDRGCEGLGEVQQLTELALNYPNLGDGVAPQLGSLAGLRHLDLSHTRVSDVTLAAIGKLTALETLILHHTRVTNRGFASLRGLSQLRTLELDHTDIVDSGLAELSGLTQLRTLRLDSTLVTDDGLDALVGMRALERLNLSRTVVTAAGLAKLQRLPKLRVLSYEGTRADDGANANAQALRD